MLRNKLIALLLLSLLVAVCHGNKLKDSDSDYEEEEQESKPNPSLNKPFTLEELQLLSNDVYISQFLSFILTGNYQGTGTDDGSLDELSIDDFLDFGLLFLQNIIADDPPEDLAEVTALFKDLNRIKDTLKNNGSSAVFFKDLKPYLTLSNAKKGALLYLALNQKTYAQRFKKYLNDELLGGLHGYCKLHTALWFEEIAKGKMWAIEMFDSMAKLPPGVLDANINWPGSYGICTGVLNDNLTIPIKGKYCRASIGFPISQFAGDLPIDDSIGLTYGMCISHMCNTTEVASLVSNSLKLMSVFKSAWVKNVECSETVPMSSASIAWT